MSFQIPNSKFQIQEALLTLPSPPSPILFEIGPFALRYYGLFIALGIAVATWLTARELARKGYDDTLALDSLFFVVPPGFVGARLNYVMTEWHRYSNDLWGIFEIWNGGLGIYGAVVGGVLGGALFCRYRSVNPLVFADAAAPGLVLGQAIGRWGNYFNQELFGLPTTLPWAIEIAPQNRPPGFADAEAFHPTFFYESVWNVLVALALLYIARHFASRLKNGDVFLLYVSFYSFGRFFVEALRIDPLFIIGESFRGYLLVSSVLALGCALIFFLRHPGTASRQQSG